MMTSRSSHANLALDGDGVRGTLCLTCLTTNAIFYVDRCGNPSFPFTILFEFPGLVYHERAYIQAGAAANADVMIYGDFWIYNSFSGINRFQGPVTSRYDLVNFLI